MLLSSMIEDNSKRIKDIIDKDNVLGKHIGLVKEVEMLNALTVKLRYHMNHLMFKSTSQESGIDDDSTYISKTEASSPQSKKLKSASISPFEIKEEEKQPFQEETKGSEFIERANSKDCSNLQINLGLV